MTDVTVEKLAEKSTEIANLAAQAIGSVSSVASMVLTGFAIFIGVAGIVGYFAAIQSLKKAAMRAAKDRVNEIFADTSETANILRDVVKQEVDQRFKNGVVLAVEPPPKSQTQGNDKFPPAPENGEKP